MGNEKMFDIAVFVPGKCVVRSSWSRVRDRAGNIKTG
jgi:hypothetical protein